jgi:hypothetical protein
MNSIVVFERYQGTMYLLSLEYLGVMDTEMVQGIKLCFLGLMAWTLMTMGIFM